MQLLEKSSYVFVTFLVVALLNMDIYSSTLEVEQ